jgi:Putative metal-binding motif
VRGGHRHFRAILVAAFVGILWAAPANAQDCVPSAEICDGSDNDCDGLVDAVDPDLINVGQVCGSTCGMGVTVCMSGVLVCQSTEEPQPEVCDGLDNDCNGSIDDGLAPMPCGTDEGECQAGTLVCVNGSNECHGAVGPSPEVCNGRDDDCDGLIDEDLVFDAPCSPAYDVVLFPGQRDQGSCKAGVIECGPTGELICSHGVGPTPEVCDGFDNDCDGEIDELGDSPDGLSGSTNPSDASQALGEPCGWSEGACEPGEWVCVDFAFECVGGVTPQPEVCDCVDNDCDGETDEEAAPDAGEPGVCKGDKACVVYNDACQCASLCQQADYPCPTGGFACELVKYSQTGEWADYRCVIDGCFYCDTKAVKDEYGVVACAPDGTVLDGGVVPPVCVCRQNACHPPCWGETCELPLVCTDFGKYAGECVEDNCWNVPCPLGEVCDQGTCVDDPCAAGGCEDAGSGGMAGSEGGTVDGGLDASDSDARDPRANWGLATGGGGCSCDMGSMSTPGGMLAGLALLGGLLLVLRLFRRARQF